ncbi:GNAT family N-acetyltransferase [Acholeplasma granularum]|uniref:GNAT family N-acetyltransferase n=1 Tax=Acholeplasma granularum TaxID=264635 RepID=UPI00047221EB|nr:GNAT family N-acetyltransferase [Acholeplasma granularum]
MNDMLVSLYNLDYKKVQLEENIEIKRLLSPNSDQLISFIETNFTKNWASEAKAAVYKNQPTCFVAISGNKIVGFSLYDATAKGYFGPIGVDPLYQRKNIGKSLIIHTLEAMYHDGYGYAIIGSVGESVQPFYEKSVHAIKIDRNKNIYERLIRGK